MEALNHSKTLQRDAVVFVFSTEKYHRRLEINDAASDFCLTCKNIWDFWRCAWFQSLFIINRVFFLIYHYLFCFSIFWVWFSYHKGHLTYQLQLVVSKAILKPFHRWKSFLRVTSWNHTNNTCIRRNRNSLKMTGTYE